MFLDAGWAPQFDPRFFHQRFLHAMDFEDERGNRIDLHAHVLPMSCERGADDAFGAASAPLTAGGVRTRTLCATDHLLHVLIHGQYSVALEPVRWYADAATILRAAGEHIDWDRFVTLARARRVTGFLFRALDDLQAALDLRVPSTVSSALAQSPRNLSERLMIRGAREKAGHPWRNIQFHCGRFLRGTRGFSTGARLRMVPPYFSAWLQTDRVLTALARIGVKSVRSLAIRIGAVSRRAAFPNPPPSRRT
jgi:hypothetical protein